MKRLTSIVGLVVCGMLIMHSAAFADDMWPASGAPVEIRAVAVPVDPWGAQAPTNPSCGAVLDSAMAGCCRFNNPPCNDLGGTFNVGQPVALNTYWEETWGGGVYDVVWSLGVLPNGYTQPIILQSQVPVSFGDVPAGDWAFCIWAVEVVPPAAPAVSPITQGFAVQTPTGSVPPQGCNSFAAQ